MAENVFMPNLKKGNTKPLTITGQINAKALELLKKNPKGLRWADMLKMIKESYPKFHPKTINGCVWKLVEKYPELVYKPQKGLFKLRG